MNRFLLWVLRGSCVLGVLGALIVIWAVASGAVPARWVTLTQQVTVIAWAGSVWVWSGVSGRWQRVAKAWESAARAVVEREDSLLDELDRLRQGDDGGRAR